MSAMRGSSHLDDDELDNISDQAGLLRSDHNRGNNDTPKDKEEMPFCGCFSIRYYQPFFDVDTSDVTSRVSQSVMYCQRTENFMSSVKDKPDLYGPFWITTTLVFTVAFCSHMSAWLSSWMYGGNWENDFQSLMNAATLIYGFGTAAPTLAYLGLRQIEVNVKLIPLVCLYGYSLTIFIVASLVCLVPSTSVVWLSLLGAAGVSSVFLMRSLAPLVMEVSPDSVKTATIAIGVLQMLFAIILKAAIF